VDLDPDPDSMGSSERSNTREHRGIYRRSALREDATNRYNKERRITQDKESSELDADLKLIGFVLNTTKFPRMSPKFAGIQSDSTTSDRFTR
jgi:hypothetical protein